MMDLPPGMKFQFLAFLQHTIPKIRSTFRQTNANQFLPPEKKSGSLFATLDSLSNPWHLLAL
jgi:hypothetical protein